MGTFWASQHLALSAGATQLRLTACSGMPATAVRCSLLTKGSQGVAGLGATEPLACVPLTPKPLPPAVGCAPLPPLPIPLPPDRPPPLGQVGAWSAVCGGGKCCLWRTQRHCMHTPTQQHVSHTGRAWACMGWLEPPEAESSKLTFECASPAWPPAVRPAWR